MRAKRTAGGEAAGREDRGSEQEEKAERDSGGSLIWRGCGVRPYVE